VAHGGWAIDLHPADGLYSELPSCTQWHSKGIYGIPYRCYYSRNIKNLFLAGRIISATHVAFGSTRVMATCGAGGQAVGIAAALCFEKNCQPRDLTEAPAMRDLLTRLDRAGQFLIGGPPADPEDLAASATATASSRFKLSELKVNKAWVGLDSAWAMLLPLHGGTSPAFTFEVAAEQATTLRVELWKSSRPAEFSMEELIEALDVPAPEGRAKCRAEMRSVLQHDGYYFLKLAADPALRVRVSDQRLTGVVALSNAYNKAVATSAVQTPPDGIGVDGFEFWLPKRRPEGKNLALKIEPAVDLFGPENVLQGPARPTNLPNAWVADADDPAPELWLDWPGNVSIRQVMIEFDPDWDHPMESVLMTHPEEVVPFQVKDFDLLDSAGKVIHQVRDHHAARFALALPEALETRRIGLRILSTHGAPAAVFRFRCHS
jgi:hypothetical protein